MDDEKIVELYFLRNEDAIKETSEKYGNRLKNVARNILGSDEDAMECVNDCYVKVWNAIPPSRPTHLFAFLATIARRIAIDRLAWNTAQKRSGIVVELTHELEECIGNTQSDEFYTGENNELSKLLSEFLGSIETKRRIIFLRRYWYSESIKDISQRMNMSEGAVKVSLHRTRKDLKKYLIKEEYFNEKN